jgi:hypothetical protein
MPSSLGGIGAFLGLACLFACDAAPTDEGDDASIGGKADGISDVEEGSLEARAILRLADEATFETLDIDVGLDRRAAEAIVANRPASDSDDADGYQTLEELDLVPFVGRSAFGRMLDFVIAEGLVGRPLKIATFNIRWFGLDGDVSGSIGTETRVDTVDAFIDEHLGDRDVIVFQEIVDVELFTDKVMPDHTCITYDGFIGKHQHVMLCHTDAYELRMADDEDDFELESIKIGQVRPGVHGTLVSTEDGEPVAHVIAVHLKADPASTERRLEQARALATRVERLRASSSLPIITIGDFNTHLAVDTGLARNDEDTMGDVLAPLERVALPVTFTYQEKDGTRFRLDQAYVSPEIAIDAVKSAGPCDTDLETNGPAIVEYFDRISDHCPLAFDLTL